VKGLSLTQPWATLVAIGAKRIETRSWRTYYRGVIAIHAARRWTHEDQWLGTHEPFKAALRAAGLNRATLGCDANALPRGVIVATARVVDCVSTSQDSPYYPDDSNPESDFGDYGPDRWMWVLDDVRPLTEPVPCRGALGLWTVPPDVTALIAAQIGAPA
jgi:hypothetical protein